MIKIKGYFFIFLIIANIYFLLASIPQFILIKRAPANTIYPLFQVSQIPDYNGYLSAITLGQNGYWYFRNPYTSEKPIISIFYLFYILIGKITGIFHIWQPIAFHLARILAVELFIISIFVLCYSVTGKSLVFWSSLFSLFATITPPTIFNQIYPFTGNIPWWSKYDAIQRLDGIPHHILGQALFLLSISFLILFLRHAGRKYMHACLICTFLAGIIFPPSLFPIIFALPLTLMIIIIKSLLTINNTGISRKQFLPLFALFITAFITLFISWIQTQIGYHKSVWIDWEIARWNRGEPEFDKNLIMLFGILPIIALPAIIAALKDVKWEKIFLVCWAILPILLLPFVNILSISKIRLLGFAPFVPWGILCTISIFETVRSYRKYLSSLLLISFMGISFTISVLILLNNIYFSQKLPLYDNIFVPKETWRMFDFVKKEIPKDSVILSDEYMGNLLPAHAPVISYFGHINLTYKFLDKQNNVWRFYTLRMDEEEAKEFLKKNNIKYVFFGHNEKGLGNLDKLAYPFLMQIYEENGNIFYKIGS